MNVPQRQLLPDERAIVRHALKSKYIYSEALIFDDDSGEIRWVAGQSGVYCSKSFERWLPCRLMDYLEDRAPLALPMRTDPLEQVRYVGDLKFLESFPGGCFIALSDAGELAAALDYMRFWIQSRRPEKVTPSNFEDLWERCTPLKYEIVPAKPGEKTIWEELELRLLDRECTLAAQEVERAREAMERAMIRLRYRQEDIYQAKRAELKAVKQRESELRKRRNQKVFRVPEFIKRAGQAAQLTQQLQDT